MNSFDDLEISEKKYSANQHNGTPSLFSSVRMIPGTIPILIDAPHAVHQLRNGEFKASDAYTGSMTEWLCAQTGAHGCIRFYNDRCDPNYDSSGKGKRYRDNLGRYCKEHDIKLVIDLHGTANREIVCEIGTNDGLNLCGHPEYARRLADQLALLGNVKVDGYFKASRPGNISRSLAFEYQIPSFQIEIGRTYRKNPEARMKFLIVLAEYIKGL